MNKAKAGASCSPTQKSTPKSPKLNMGGYMKVKGNTGMPGKKKAK